MNYDRTQLPPNLKKFVHEADALMEKVAWEIVVLHRAGLDTDTIVSVLEERYNGQIVRYWKEVLDSNALPVN